MKATEQYFPVSLFITLFKVVLTFESVYEILSVTFKWKLLRSTFLSPNKVILPFDYVDKIIQCDYSNERC